MIFRHGAKIFPNFTKEHRRGCQTAFSVSIKTFWGRTVFWKKNIMFLSCLYVGQNTFWSFVDIYFRWVCRNCILRVRRKLLRKFYMWKLLLFSSSWDIEWKFFGLFSKIFQQCCQNCSLQVQTKILGFYINFSKAWTKFTDVGVERERNWQTSGNKTFHLGGRFCYHFKNMVLNINCAVMNVK